MSKKIDWLSQFQILKEVVCVSLRVNALEKGIYTSVYKMITRVLVDAFFFFFFYAQKSFLQNSTDTQMQTVLIYTKKNISLTLFVIEGLIDFNEMPSRVELF